MRKLLACFCFDEGSLGGHDIARIVEEAVRFETPHIIARHFMKNGGTFNPEAHLAKVAGLDEVGSLRLGQPDFEGNYFDFGGVGAWNFETLAWCCSLDQLPEKAFFDQLAQQLGLMPAMSAMQTMCGGNPSHLSATTSCSADPIGACPRSGMKILRKSRLIP